MSLRELYEWYEFYSEQPFFADRIEMQLATICLQISGFGKSKSKHEDFMICKKSDRKTGFDKNDTSSIKTMLMSIAKPVKI